MPKSTHVPSPTMNASSGSEMRHLSKQEFGRRLWELMVKNDMNQSDVARASGVGRDSISKYVNGKQFPTPIVAARIAKVFKVEPEELLPNLAEQAYEREAPSLEMRAVHGKPGRVWLRVDQEVSSVQAAKIMSILNETMDDN